ncbi:hypothetical protein E1292_08360 [Nonomuraea deserti]|uniref:Glycosyltransferase RgtA/B/C/D-like domain-containing protein n=1 Tax=Nonomuraea deserti TaxID=1848322 RepID=A0A4R4W5F2_9ACTN|nr:hypothetical protein [Nonomuraea deserti]TDD10285.1 hypothetical protein E1292_08360 [Nonomuraea deserti]
MSQTTEPRTGMVITVPAPIARAAAAASRWAGRHGVLLAALLLVGAAMAWKAAIARNAYFKEDDFEFVARAMENDLSFDYLTRIHFGQFMPGGFLLAWISARLEPFGWGYAAGMVLALHACAALAVLRMLRVVFGARPAILAPLLVFLVAPVTVPVLAWWAAGLNTVFLQIALPMAVASHWHHLRTGRLRHAVAAALWVLFGLLGFVKGFALPLVLLALTAIYHGGLRRALRGHVAAWSMQLVVLAGFGALYVQRSLSAPNTGALPIFDQAAGFLWELLGRTFATTVLGGPWRWFAGNDWGVVSPPLPVVIASLVTLAAMVAVTTYYRRRAGLAWALLLGYVLVADALPVLWGRVHLLGSFAGTDTRYVADAVPLVALVAGLVLLPLPGEAEPYRRALPARERVSGVCGAALGLFVGASLVSVSVFAGHLGAERRHRYIETARAELARAAPGTVIYDRLVPPDVLPSSYGAYSLTSKVLGALAPPRLRATMQAPPAALEGMVFDDQGRLRPVDVQGVPLAPRTRDRCWPVTGGTVQVPLDNRVTRAEGTLVRLGYAARADTKVTLWMADRATDVALRAGLGRVFVLAEPGADRIVVDDLPPGVCIGDVTPGQAVPRP